MPVRSIRASLLAFRAACIVLLLTALAHTLAHVRPEQPPGSDAEGQLRTLMRTLEFDAPGGKITIERILVGFSWHFPLSLAGLGVLGIALGWSASRPLETRRTFALIAAVILVLASVNSQVHFFAVPTVMLGTAAAVMAAAFVLSPRPTPAPFAQGAVS